MPAKEPLIKSWMNSLSPESPIAALASTCNRITHALIPTLERLALENSESQSVSPRLNKRLPNKTSATQVSALKWSLFLTGLLCAVPVQAEAQPSMDFLEYLGGIENEIDGELSSPLDLDLEHSLIVASPDSDKTAGSEVDTYE